jgi:hypothetical protein
MTHEALTASRPVQMRHLCQLMESRPHNELRESIREADFDDQDCLVA